MSNFAAEHELTRFKANEIAIDKYKEGLRMLQESGFLNLLRVFARPFSIDRGANPYMAAYNGAMMEGYQQCLDDLIYFEHKHLTSMARVKQPLADFGGLSAAVATGKITKQEADSLKGRK